MKLDGWPSPRTSAWESEEFQASDPAPEFTAVVRESIEPASALMNPPVAPEVQAREIAGYASHKALEDLSRSEIQEIADEQAAELQQLIEEADRSGPGARGVLFLPYLAGERTPIFDPLARGTVTGLTLAHGRGDLYRAALEGTAFAVRHNIEVMREAGVAIERAVAVGGGTRGGLWTRVVSDVTGLEQQIPSVTVGASLGAAYLAARGVGEEVDIGRWNPITATVEPDHAVREFYEERYRLYRRAYPALAPVMHGLASAPGPRAVP